MAESTAASGVYVTLKDLVELQYKARGFSFLPRQPIHSLLSGLHASRLRGRGLNFEEMRRYFPGDDIRRIDWKATLRTRRTQLRVYTEEKERSVLLLIDQRRSMFFGSRRNMKSVTAAEMASLAAWRVVAQKDRVGALVFNDTQIVEIRPQRSRKAVMRILQAVVEQNHALSLKTNQPSSPEMLNEVLRRAERLAKHDALICLISDGKGHGPESDAIATRMARHNDMLVAFIHDPLEVEFPRSGSLVVSDGIGQLEIDTNDESFRSTFRRTFESKFSGIKKILLHRKIPVIPISAAADIIDQLVRHLGKHQK